MKKLVFGFAIVMAAFTSQASYLWWEMNSTDMTDIGAWAKSQGLYSEDVMARVVAVTYDESGKEVRQSVSAPAGFVSEWYTAPNQSVDLSAFGENYQTYSYYVEVVKASTTASEQTLIGRNNKATSYTDLSANGSITGSLSDVPPATAVWHGGSGSPTAAPEPTSAMLMLLGVAGLALKRKQKKA